jgi:hypothetical protein
MQDLLLFILTMVNTFLPYASFEASARALDFRRLGKQRVEAWQIWQILGRAESVHPVPDGLGERSWRDKTAWMAEASAAWKKTNGKRLGWASHPAVTLWIGYRTALAVYYNTMCAVWAERGGKNILLQPIPVDGMPPMPAWIRLPAVHNAFRWRLLRKELVQFEHDVKGKPWYIHQPDFIAAVPVPDYVWTPT